MSVRAYRINDYAKSETFNLWHDEKVMEILEDNRGQLCSLDLNCDNGGYIGIAVELIEKILGEPDVDEDVKESFGKDLEWAKKNEEDWLKYYCF